MRLRSVWIPASASGPASSKPLTIASRASCGADGASPFSASESSRPARPCWFSGGRFATACSIASGTEMSDAERAQKPTWARSAAPFGGASEGTIVSQKACRVIRCASVKTSLVAMNEANSPICSETAAL